MLEPKKVSALGSKRIVRLRIASYLPSHRVGIPGTLVIVDGLSVVNADLIEVLRKLLLEDPATHSYLLYDLIYEPRSSSAKLVVEDSEVVGYALLWRGRGACAVHLWGSLPEELIREFISRASTLEARYLYVHVHSKELETPAITVVKELFESFSIETFVDMVVDRDSFEPFEERVDAEIRVLDPRRDAKALARLKASRGSPLDVGESRRILESILYVGAFVNNELVSTAAAIVRLRDAWIVADVYTDPKHRGKGFAKAVTSVITSIALSAGVKKVALHVNERNEVAKKVYRRLGYREVSKKMWLVIRKS